MALFRMVELEEGMPVQFVGNYVLRANEPPKYGFIEVDEHELQAQLANAAASEVDAVQGRQECERELREARAELGAVLHVLKRLRSVAITARMDLHTLKDDLDAAPREVVTGDVEQLDIVLSDVKDALIANGEDPEDV